MNDKKDPIKVCDIQFSEDNQVGIDLIKLLSRENFNKQKLINFCEYQIKKQTIKVEQDKQIDFLCSEEGKEYIKEKLLTIEYPEEVINELEIEIKRKNTTCPTPKEPIVFCGPKIQDWIKKQLIYDDKNNLISTSELERLQDKDYCKTTFNLQFPLLVNTSYKRFISGHARYWVKPYSFLQHDYYVCSEWWKEYSQIYKEKFTAWLNKISKNNTNN